MCILTNLLSQLSNNFEFNKLNFVHTICMISVLKRVYCIMTTFCIRSCIAVFSTVWIVYYLFISIKHDVEIFTRLQFFWNQDLWPFIAIVALYDVEPEGKYLGVMKYLAFKALTTCMDALLKCKYKIIRLAIVQERTFHAMFIINCQFCTSDSEIITHQ